MKKVLDKFEGLVDEDAMEREEIINETIQAMSGKSEDNLGESIIDDGLSDVEETE